MAPERVTAPETVDARSDIYALGAVAWLLLTGRTIFTFTSDADLLWKVVNVAPERVSAAASQAIPGELERLILRCLAKDPEERPQDVCELLGGLDSIPVAPWTQSDARRRAPSRD
jgi:serine/threonine protein kinase